MKDTVPHVIFVCMCCNLCGHLQRCQTPDIENSRKTAEEGAEWVTVKEPETAEKTAETPEKQLF